MRPVGEADRGRGARDFLDRDAMLEIAEAEPAVFLGRSDPVQPERAHLRPEVAGELVVAVDGGRARRDLLVREIARDSRIMSALSPRSKLKGRELLRSIGGVPGICVAVAARIGSAVRVAGLRTRCDAILGHALS